MKNNEPKTSNPPDVLKMIDHVSGVFPSAPSIKLAKLGDRKAANKDNELQIAPMWGAYSGQMSITLIFDPEKWNVASEEDQTECDTARVCQSGCHVKLNLINLFFDLGV